MLIISKDEYCMMILLGETDKILNTNIDCGMASMSPPSLLYLPDDPAMRRQRPTLHVITDTAMSWAFYARLGDKLFIQSHYESMSGVRFAAIDGRRLIEAGCR